MNTASIESNRELQQVLWACYDYWKGIQEPLSSRGVCYSWVLGRYKERFKIEFHQSKLRHLVNLGFLEKDETARGGGRRYYRLTNPDRILSLLRTWGL